MIRFEDLSTTEKGYPFVKATAKAAYKNGVLGTVADGVFTAGATGWHAIMNIEDGDDAKSPDFVIPEGADLRVADFTLADGKIVNITADELPDTYAKEDKLISTTDGTLIVGTPSSKYLEVVELTRYGCRAKIVN